MVSWNTCAALISSSSSSSSDFCDPASEPTDPLSLVSVPGTKKRISVSSSPICFAPPDLDPPTGVRLENSSDTSVFPAMLELATCRRGSSNAILSEMVNARSVPLFSLIASSKMKNGIQLTLEIGDTPIPAFI